MPLSFDECISSDSNTTKQPIQKYINHRVLHMKTLSDGVLGLIVVSQVIRAADGLWLYVRLMLDEIEKSPSAALIQRHLRNVPLGLTQLYTQILRSKESSVRAIDFRYAQQTLLWLDLNDYCSAFLPNCYTDYATLVLVLRNSTLHSLSSIQQNWCRSCALPYREWMFLNELRDCLRYWEVIR